MRCGLPPGDEVLGRPLHVLAHPWHNAAGVTPDVSFFCRGGRPRFLAKEVFASAKLQTGRLGVPPRAPKARAPARTSPQIGPGKILIRPSANLRPTAPFRFTVQFAPVLRFPSANGRFQRRHRSPAPPRDLAKNLGFRTPIRGGCRGFPRKFLDRIAQNSILSASTFAFLETDVGTPAVGTGPGRRNLVDFRGAGSPAGDP